MPVDLGGLGLYLIGFIAFPLAILLIGDDSGKRFLSWSFALYVLGPLTFCMADRGLENMRDARIKREIKAGEQRNREAFAEYCKSRKRAVYSKASSQEGGAAILVRVETGFYGDNSQFSADRISYYLGKNPDLCVRTGVETLEGIFKGAYSKKTNGYEIEVRRYSCSKGNWVVVPEALSRFELVLGQAGGIDLAPWHGQGVGRWMATSSVRIVERLTGEIVAEDTMYFLNGVSGEGGCPEGMSQLSELLAEVFGHH